MTTVVSTHGTGRRGIVAPNGLVHLRAAGVSLLLDATDDLLPTVVHWGRDLGELSPGQLDEIARAATVLRDNTLDAPLRISIVPQGSAGWMGTPGLSGHRTSDAWSPRFVNDSVDVEIVPGAGGTFSVAARDDDAGLALRVELTLHPSGLVSHRAEVTNTAPSPYQLEQLSVALPVPPVATEVLDFAGRWSRERAPQRHRMVVGTHLRDTRRGRTGADAPVLLAVGEAGFGFRRGEVWSVHVAFSGNHRSWVEHTSQGHTLLGGTETLLPGEIVLGEGESYRTPTVHAAYGDGLDEVSHRFHDHLRARATHPTTPRKVVLNTWEAVYFDHDLETLLSLARAGAAIGVERFVLDDGWFSGRRDDTTSLGDWEVDHDVWPGGLHPLVDEVRSLGMDFGLWFEPEMISGESELARSHPDWILRTGPRVPLTGRNQHVLDLANPAAYAYVLERLRSLVEEYRLDFIKWDHNRDLVEAGSTVGGGPGVHAQTLAVYRLWRQLHDEFPGLEIESCSSGGARVDLGAIEHTDRVWVSDCLEPLERAPMMQWTAQILPLELLGSHVGAPRSDTTGRTHDLSFRAAVALFGHFGIEWDIRDIDADDRVELASWVALHKRLRPLLHTGRTVRVDHPMPEVLVHGVVATDQREAVFSLALLATPATWPVGRVRIPGLDETSAYLVQRLAPSSPTTVGGSDPTWWDRPVPMTGRALAHHGIQFPTLQPEQAVLLRIVADPAAGPTS